MPRSCPSSSNRTLPARWLVSIWGIYLVITSSSKVSIRPQQIVKTSRKPRISCSCLAARGHRTMRKRRRHRTISAGSPIRFRNHLARKISRKRKSKRRTRKRRTQKIFSGILALRRTDLYWTMCIRRKRYRSTSELTTRRKSRNLTNGFRSSSWIISSNSKMFGTSSKVKSTRSLRTSTESYASNSTRGMLVSMCWAHRWEARKPEKRTLNTSPGFLKELSTQVHSTTSKNDTLHI